MPAYVVVDTEITDPATFREYQQVVGPIVAKYGGKVQAQAVMGQSSFYSVTDRRLHFGLGRSTHADLEIHWTNGLVERFPAVASNQLVTIKEGQGISLSSLQTIGGQSKPKSSNIQK